MFFFNSEIAFSQSSSEENQKSFESSGFILVFLQKYMCPFLSQSLKKWGYLCNAILADSIQYFASLYSFY